MNKKNKKQIKLVYKVVDNISEKDRKERLAHAYDILFTATAKRIKEFGWDKS